jgi:hypothetical protein
MPKNGILMPKNAAIWQSLSHSEENRNRNPPVAFFIQSSEE